MNYTEGLEFLNKHLQKDKMLYTNFIKQLVDYNYFEENFDNPLAAISLLYDSGGPSDVDTTHIKYKIQQMLSNGYMSDNINPIWKKFIHQFKQFVDDLLNSDGNEKLTLMNDYDNILLKPFKDNDFDVRDRVIHSIVNNFNDNYKKRINYTGNSFESANIFKIIFEAIKYEDNYDLILNVKRKLFINTMNMIVYYIIPRVKINNLMDYEAFCLNAVNLTKLNKYVYLDIVDTLTSTSGSSKNSLNIFINKYEYLLRFYSKVYVNNEFPPARWGDDNRHQIFKNETIDGNLIRNISSMYMDNKKMKCSYKYPDIPLNLSNITFFKTPTELGGT